MTWIVRQGVRTTHNCQLPAKQQQVKPPGYNGADYELLIKPVGAVGDVWLCDTCGDYWQLIDGRPAPGGWVTPFNRRWQRISPRRGVRIQRRELKKRGTV